MSKGSVIPPDGAQLTRCSTGATELARISTLTREDAKTLIDNRWWTSLGPILSDPDDEPDRHWEWRRLISKYQNSPYYEARCIKSQDGEIQAAMLYRIDALSALDAGSRAIFVDRLATAPRNRDDLAKAPAFRGCGSALLIYAVAASYSLGFSGRLNLFPIANEPFYIDRGFVKTNVQSDDETLFELPARKALSLLRMRGLING